MTLTFEMQKYLCKQIVKDLIERELIENTEQYIEPGVFINVAKCSRLGSLFISFITSPDLGEEA